MGNEASHTAEHVLQNVQSKVEGRIDRFQKAYQAYNETEGEAVAGRPREQEDDGFVRVKSVKVEAPILSDSQVQGKFVFLRYM